MRTTIDGQELFDERQLKIEVGSFKRDSIERAVPSLDGVLTIDLGSRGRKIKQTGTLRVISRSQMDDRVSAISNYMDGCTHTLIAADGSVYQNLRIDSFKVTSERVDGAGITVEYEIIYTQLV